MTESVRRIAHEARRALCEGPEAIARQQRARLVEMVAYVRARSPYYRQLYRGLPETVDDSTLLPVTNKKLLMDRFDDWVTDRRVTLEQVQAFVADPCLVGHRFQDRYVVATSSGTSGLRGLFVLDGRNLAMHTALASHAGSGLGAGDLLRMLAHAGRTAIVSAPGGHFFTVASAAWFRNENPVSGRILRVFSINQPLAELVAELNRYQPATLSGFLSMLTQMAGEQEAGRLRIDLAVIIAGGETATPEILDRITTAFGATMRSAYAATECGFLSLNCAHGWYHVNSDWAVLEPVDAECRPVPPGQPSQTVLLSNLANRVQPILRYDLGDSVLQRPDSCPCGNPLPAIRVRGRAADMLTFPTRGHNVDISPMLLATSLDQMPGVEQFQLVQTTPTTLRVRLRQKDNIATEDTWHAVHDEIVHLLTKHKIDDITLEHASEPPQRSPGGKFRRIIPLATP